jgi:hypothetical protein
VREISLFLELLSFFKSSKEFLMSKNNTVHNDISQLMSRNNLIFILIRWSHDPVTISRDQGSRSRGYILVSSLCPASRCAKLSSSPIYDAYTTPSVTPKCYNDNYHLFIIFIFQIHLKDSAAAAASTNGK